ncbi:hypothetical protein GGI1_09478, partial [Acidithiobacillus sp. GGI-221]
MPNFRAMASRGRVDVHPDDHVGAHQFGALNHIQADAAQSKKPPHWHPVHLRRKHHGTNRPWL